MSQTLKKLQVLLNHLGQFQFGYVLVKPISKWMKLDFHSILPWTWNFWMNSKLFQIGEWPPLGFQNAKFEIEVHDFELAGWFRIQSLPSCLLAFLISKWPKHFEFRLRLPSFHLLKLLLHFSSLHLLAWTFNMSNLTEHFSISPIIYFAHLFGLCLNSIYFASVLMIVLISLKPLYYA